MTAHAGPSRLREHVDKLAAAPRNRVSSPAHLTESRDYSAAVLTSYGWDVREQHFSHRAVMGISEAGAGKALPFVIHRNVAGVNLVAQRPGQRNTGTLLIAHLDTVPGSPGADDNASGVAVLLEVARALSRAGHNSDVTIAIVDLEEIGTLGSRALYRELKRTTTLPTTVICFDAPGYFTTTPGTQRLPLGMGLIAGPAVRAIKARDNAGDFALVVHRPRAAEHARLLHAAASTAGLPTVLLEDRRLDGYLQRFTRMLNPAAVDLDRSDHAPFWQARIPALFITGTATLRNKHYHQPTDTPETLDYERLNLLTSSTAAAISQL